MLSGKSIHIWFIEYFIRGAVPDKIQRKVINPVITYPTVGVSLSFHLGIQGQIYMYFLKGQSVH